MSETAMSEAKRKMELLAAGMAFTFFVCVACYRLTNASLWFDEAVEYWYSKLVVGAMPFELHGTENMYQRIVSTYQPPLYNCIMHFWLKVSDGEWWFRFFGVVMGFIGMLGIYSSVKKMGGSLAASLTVLFSSTVFQLVYYWQECAEYCLMLGTLCWTVYFWICVVKESGRRNIILFTVSAVLPVYSQYGAVFPVFAMSVSAFLAVLLKKDKKSIGVMCAAYSAAAVFAALPLYFFFLRKQMGEARSAAFDGGLVSDFFAGMQTVLKWNLFPQYDDGAVWAFLVIFLSLAAASFLFGKNFLTKYMALFHVICYASYYFAVKTGLYAYGTFGSRYNLFFLPPWIIMGVAVCLDVSRVLQKRKSLRSWDISGFGFLFQGICICAVFCFGVFSWTSKLQGNWVKEDIRGAVDAWYGQNASEKSTIVYYAADPGFAYYVRRNDRFSPETERNVNYMEWIRDRTADEYEAYVDSIYGDDWPDEIYVVAQHVRDDLNTFVDNFISRGYVLNDIYNLNGARLIYLSGQ